LDPLAYGFTKLKELMQFVCTNTALCMYSQGTYEVALGYRNSPPEGFVQLPDVEQREIHSEATYRAVLAAGGPVFRLPAHAVLSSSASFVAALHPVRESFGSIVAKASQNTKSPTDASELRDAFLCLNAAGCFDRIPEGVRLSDQVFTLRRSLSSESSVLGALRKAMIEKLKGRLGDIDESIVDALLPSS
jgi:hypothetical protein